MRFLSSGAIVFIYEQKGTEHARSNLVCGGCTDGGPDEPAFSRFGLLRRRRGAKGAGSLPRRGSAYGARRLRCAAARRFREGMEVVAVSKGPLGARVDLVRESEPQSTWPGRIR